MIELEQEDPIPQGDLALQITALSRETNGFGDIFGGWLVAQMDLAGTAMASRVAGGRVATVAIAAWEGDIDRERAHAVLNGTHSPEDEPLAEPEVASTVAAH